MSIADGWRREKGGLVGPMSGSMADRISARVIEATPNEEVASATMKLVEAVHGTRVTFREKVRVSLAPSDGYRETFDKLREVVVFPHTRGTTVMIMVDGRTFVELEDGSRVLARVGEDCRILRWWHRVSDWFAGV